MDIEKIKLYKIGMIFGAFDMYHIGHLNIIRAAKALCSKLVVCVSSDEYIEKQNGYNTIIPLSQRFKIVISCTYVDDVEVQDEKYTKLDAIHEHQPDVIFVGDSRKLKYKDDKVHGIQKVYLPYERGVSLKLLRKRLKGGK